MQPAKSVSTFLSIIPALETFESQIRAAEMKFRPGLISLVYFQHLMLCFSSLGLAKDVENKVTVSTPLGDILGEKINFTHKNVSENENIKSVSRFLGIPYAEAPLRNLRFKPPLDPSPWKPAIYNATYFRSACIQDPGYINFFWKNFSLGFSEDCLYLNVYSPGDPTKLQSNERTGKPVMVYIHGGGYEAGSPIVSPGDILPLWGVVLVTIQYRLGFIGFFTTGDHLAPGNYGMLDQVHALKWVKKNIRSFGGDPNKVTIFGESAGGSSVGLHTLSPLSEGLFHRAIAISGIDFSPFAISTKEIAQQLSKKYAALLLSCSQTDNESLLSCLRRVDAKKLIIGQANSWRPVVDGKFLTDSPRKLRKQGKAQKVPLMAGFTSDEGAYFIEPFLKYKELNRATFAEFVNMIFRNVRTFGLENEKEPGAVFELALQSQYLPWPDSKQKSKLVQKLIDLVTDYSFAAPTDAVLEEHSMLAPVFMYEYGYRSASSPNSPWMGVTHKDDTPFQFGFPFMDLNNLQKYDETDQNMSTLIITLFTNFAKYGNPTPEIFQKITWTPFNQSNRAYLYIQLPPATRNRFRPCNTAFWNRYYQNILDNINVSAIRKRSRGKITTASINALSLQVFFAIITTISEMHVLY